MATSETSPKTIRLMTALLLLATFAAGTVTGGGLVHWFVKSEHSGLRHGMGPLPWERLELTQAQSEKAHDILERYRPRLDAVFDETAPKVKGITDQIDREFREMLTPEQRTRFDRVLAERGNRPPLPPLGMRPPLLGDGPPARFDRGPPGAPPTESNRALAPTAPSSSGR